MGPEPPIEELVIGSKVIKDEALSLEFLLFNPEGKLIETSRNREPKMTLYFVAGCHGKITAAIRLMNVLGERHAVLRADVLAYYAEVRHRVSAKRHTFPVKG